MGTSEIRDELAAGGGPPSGFDAAVQAIRFMRERDCDFLTVENVCDYSGATRVQAIAALESEMGSVWTAEMVAGPVREWIVRYLDGAGCQQTTVRRAATRAFAERETRRVLNVSRFVGATPRLEGPDPGWDLIPGQRFVQLPDGRAFAAVTGRRWTRVFEYLSNGQLTARWFVDESTGEAREAAGARQPKRWPMSPGAQEFARWVVELASDPTGGV